MKHDHHQLNCAEMLGNMSEFIDGGLNDEMCQEIQRHLDGCENCRVVFDTTTRTIFLYQADAQETDLPGDVRDRLFGALHLDDLLQKPA